MTPEELEALLKLATWLGEDANPNETLLTDENARKIFVAAHSVKGLLEHIDSQADEIKQANHRYADLQNICDDQDKEIKRLEDALVEERARRICHQPREDKVGHWPRYENVVVDEARAQLRAEGVIR